MKYNFDEQNYAKNICSMKKDWYEFDSLYNQNGESKLLFPKENYVNMGIADMDFSVAPPILEALYNRIGKKYLGYTYSIDPQYRNIVCDWTKRQYGWQIKPEQTSVCAGVLAGLEKAISMVIPRGKKVLVATPVYSPFSMVIEGAHCKMVTTSLKNNNGYYSVDWEDFEKKVSDPEVAAFLLCNPHNPVGRVWTQEELKHMGELCFENNVFVFSDEIHCDIIRSGYKHIPFGKLFPDEKKWAVFISPGKTFNISGLTFANVVIPDEEFMQRWVNAIGVLSTNALSMEACRAAYTLCDDWLEQVREYIDSNMNFIKTFLEKYLPNAVFYIPEGTYFAWVDLTNYRIKENLHDFFFDHAAVDLDSGDCFIGGSRNFVRLAVACTHSTLETALFRMKEAINK